MGRRQTRRKRHAATNDHVVSIATEAELGHIEDNTPLHEERLTRVKEILITKGTRKVADIGCGAGALLRKIANDQQFECLLGIEPSPSALQVAKSALEKLGHPVGERVRLLESALDDFAIPDDSFDTVTLIEVIEHLPSTSLSKLERKVFYSWRPQTVILTTPNQDYNTLLGLAPHEFRHRDHYFEWNRARFRSWAQGVGDRNSYTLAFEDLGPYEPGYGSPSQMAVFSKR